MVMCVTVVVWVVGKKTHDDHLQLPTTANHKKPNMEERKGKKEWKKQRKREKNKIRATLLN